MSFELLNRARGSLAGLAGFVPALLSTVVTLLVLQSLVVRFRRYLGLRHIPGPPTAGWSRLWLLRQALGGESHKVFMQTSEKYGMMPCPIAKVGPYHVLTSDPDLIRRINAARTPYQRGEWYDALRFDPGKDNLATCPPEKHFELRAKMAAGYSGKEVEGVEAKIDRNILALVRLLEERYVAPNRPFDFGRKVQYLTLDVIAELAYGDPFGFLEKDADQYSYIKITEEQFGMLLTLTTYPWIISLFSWPLLRALMPSDKDVLGFGRLMGIAKQKAGERFGPDKKVRRDMLGSFVAHGLTQGEAESEILFQIIAGSDTVATAIRATLLLILTNPRVHASLLSEIQTHAPALAPSAVISDATARRMPYLQAVVREGLRWFPPVTGLFPKRVPAGGDAWKGVALPAGTLVGWSIWAVMRERAFWGGDADEFRPERWLEGGERVKEMEARLGLAFGYGKWQCLGKEVALIELNKVFVELLRRFDLSVVDPTKPWNSVCASIFVQSEYWMKAYKRDL